MKKNILLSLLILFSISAMSQEKGLYLSISGGLGPTGYKYNIKGVNNFATPKNQLLLGGQAGIGVSYYFTKHFGISSGIGVSHYRSYGKLLGNFEDFSEEIIADKKTNDYKHFNLDKYTDNDPFDGHVTEYNLRVRTQNWTEYQSGKFLEIPLLLNLQKKFGEKEGFGIYLGLGAKFQIPLKAEYSIKDEVRGIQASELNVYGYYADRELYLGRYDHPDLSQHGFGIIKNPGEILPPLGNNGKLDHKFNVALVGEAGILIALSKRVDLALGAFIDYGLLNLKRKSADYNLFEGPGREYVAGAEDYNVAKGIVYNSITTTDYVKKLSTLSYGGKIGIRVKIGKLSSKEKEKVVVPPAQEPDTTYATLLDKLQDLDSLVKEVLDAVKEPKQEIVYKEPDKKPDYYYEDEDIRWLFEPIYFDLDKSILKPESIENLDRKVDILNRYTDLRLLILGNTCDLGKDYYNFELGARRAEAAKKYLINKGIAPERLETSTHSKYVPELPNTSESNRMHNRRDDFRPLFPKRMYRP